MAPAADRKFEREHLYIVIRLDMSRDGEFVIPGDISLWDHSNADTYGPLPVGISGTKAFRTIDDAREHARRLNRENGEKGSRYFAVLARLDGR